jgi:hypothetical protein
LGIIGCIPLKDPKFRYIPLTPHVIDSCEPHMSLTCNGIYLNLRIPFFEALFWFFVEERSGASAGIPAADVIVSSYGTKHLCKRAECQISDFTTMCVAKMNMDEVVISLDTEVSHLINCSILLRCFQ